MVRKIIQRFPIDGTRWRKEVANGRENHGVGVHYGVAHGGVMAPLCELSNTSGLGGLCVRRHGVPKLKFHQTQNRDSLRRRLQTGPRGTGHCKPLSVVVLGATERTSELMPDTINTGTRRIEEVTLFPESLRFESEPWTAFYMAGEIIRELRKAQEIKRVSGPAPRNDMSKAA